MDVHSERDDFGRLMEMVLAAQEFGLSPAEARLIAEEALERYPLSDACDWAATVLADRVLMTAREEVPHQPNW